MNEIDRWLLPEGIEEALPEQAERLETYRRRLIDLYHRWGYDLVMPPFIEYLESLLTGVGRDLDLKTFKLTDQLTGRLMGVRADITPQVARIDAHRLKRDAPSRLCYLGTVLHTRPEGLAGTRSPLQVGAELFGHHGLDSDIEIIRLMLETLRACKVPTVHMDLGHVGIYRGLAEQAGLSAAQEAELFDMLQRKASPEIEAYLQVLALPQETATMLRGLVSLNGGEEVLARAGALLKGACPRVIEALDYVTAIAEALRHTHPQIALHFDLAELRGYHYQTGVVFAAYVPGEGQEIARGGRYDDIGKVFGRSRPATGFSTDLKVLARLGEPDEISGGIGIFAPVAGDEALEAKICALRDAGERVICALQGQQGGAAALGCERELVQKNGQWNVVKANS